jgi:transcriptional regulator
MIMYIPHHFQNKDTGEVRDFIAQNSFGILVTSSHNKIQATHIPLELEKDQQNNEVLYGHISKANPQLNNFRSKEYVLAIFSGAHAYVSSSWYNHENVPTWNYIAVHVYGTLILLDEDELMFAMKKLVDKYERNSENPVSIEKMSEKVLKQMNGITGFKIIINEIQAAYKLSQNRNDEDYKNIINKLEAGNEMNSKIIADEMKKRRM